MTILTIQAFRAILQSDKRVYIYIESTHRPNPLIGWIAVDKKYLLDNFSKFEKYRGVEVEVDLSLPHSSAYIERFF